ncbi:MAG TPA: sugar ABC transporter substrate-binding protein, partial [Actinomycetota bacterium]|nr:sugar ABC transporter substrate-binding protein [Actinomycetota bacterium]
MKGAIRSMLVLLAVFALVAAACGDDDGGETGTTGGATGTANEGGPIWVLLPDTASSDRWEGDDLPAFTEAFEAAGLVNGEDFNIVNSEGDAASQQ